MTPFIRLRFCQASWRPICGIMILLVAIVLNGCSRRKPEAESAHAQPSADRGPRTTELAQQQEPAHQKSSVEDEPWLMPEAGDEPPAEFAEAAPEIEPPSFELPEMPSAESAPPMKPFAGPAEMFPDTAEVDPSHKPLPFGARRGNEGYATIQVFYATDRQPDAVPLSAFEVTGTESASSPACQDARYCWSCLESSVRSAGASKPVRCRRPAGGGLAAMAFGLLLTGQTNIEKHGVTYTGDRGRLTRGVCEVTVPDTHQRGVVERPSLLRFEIRENQQRHIVLTSAVELPEQEFDRRLADTVAASPERDLLVFIHGYNVDFQSAVRRTAQIAVDLPFEGVPVCYSWPSQGSLMGYPIDENNAQWTVSHLKQFLLELAEESGADSINVVAHSMGNRALAAAIQQISWQIEPDAELPFDRLVLAAPDVDADHFRRDLAPAMLKVANQVTLYASSDDQALIASKGVHGYPRARRKRRQHRRCRGDRHHRRQRYRSEFAGPQLLRRQRVDLARSVRGDPIAAAGPAATSPGAQAGRHVGLLAIGRRQRRVAIADLS